MENQLFISTTDLPFNRKSCLKAGQSESPVIPSLNRADSTPVNVHCHATATNNIVAVSGDKGMHWVDERTIVLVNFAVS